MTRDFGVAHELPKEAGLVTKTPAAVFMSSVGVSVGVLVGVSVGGSVGVLIVVHMNS